VADLEEWEARAAASAPASWSRTMEAVEAEHEKRSASQILEDSRRK
jgi:hypothetical protein